MRTRGGGRRRLARVCVVGLVAGIAPVVAAMPATADSSCTFDGHTDSVTNVVGGASIAISCTGLAAGEAISINEESPLASIVQPVTSAAYERATGAEVDLTADSNGATSTSYVVPLTFVATDPAAACPPTQAQVDAGLISCSLVVRDATSNALASAHLLYADQPVPQTTPVVTVTNGSSFVAGDIVTIDGSGFWGSPPASTPVVLFGLTPAASLPASPVTVTPTTYECAPDCNGDSGLFTQGGVVSGSVVVPSGLLPGSTAMAVVQTTTSGLPDDATVGSVSASDQLTVLGPAIATAAPNNGGPGIQVQVTGTGWDPQGQTPALTFLLASTPAGSPSTGSAFVDENGNLIGTITVTGEDAAGVNPIVVTQGTTSAQSQFSVTTISSQCVGPACNSDQVLTQVVGQGDLSVSQASSSVGLSPIVLSGVVQDSIGELNPITVVDDRGILVGWTVTGTLAGDFVNQNPIGSIANNTIPAGNLSWTPSVVLAAPQSGVLSQVTAGQSSSLSTSAGTTLCAAATGGGGGSFECGASLDLTVPASIALGTYTVVLNITVA